LAFGADKHDRTAVGGKVTKKVEGLAKRYRSLPQVDDINTIPLREDVGLHPRIPAPCLVPKVDARV
jgi:hypothetical protein